MTNRLVEPKWPNDYSFASSYAATWHSSRKNSFIASILKKASENMVRLAAPISGIWVDVGCGAGAILPTLLRHSTHIVGIDTDPAKISDASALTRNMFGAVHACVASAYSLPFRDGVVDGVMCAETLEHVDERSALAEIRRVLKPAGRFIFAIPVESGTALLLRETFRRILSLSRTNFSTMGYTAKELIEHSVLGRDRENHVTKRQPSPWNHRFFSYAELLSRIEEQRFRIEQLRWSPLPLRRPWSSDIVGVAVPS